MILKYNRQTLLLLFSGTVMLSGLILSPAFAAPAIILEDVYHLNKNGIIYVNDADADQLNLPSTIQVKVTSTSDEEGVLLLLNQTGSSSLYVGMLNFTTAPPTYNMPTLYATDNDTITVTYGDTVAYSKIGYDTHTDITIEDHRKIMSQRVEILRQSILALDSSHFNGDESQAKQTLNDDLDDIIENIMNDQYYGTFTALEKTHNDITSLLKLSGQEVVLPFVENLQYSIKSDTTPIEPAPKMSPYPQFPSALLFVTIALVIIAIALAVLLFLPKGGKGGVVKDTQGGGGNQAHQTKQKK